MPKKKFTLSVADDKGATISTFEFEMDPGKYGGLMRYIDSYFDDESDEEEDYCTLHQDSMSNCSCG